jgi:cytochrome c553
MWTHYQRVGAAQSSVVLGDLDGVRASARWLAGHADTAGMPPAALPWASRMQAVARDGGEAGSLQDAAFVVARMGATCGSCHVAAVAGPRIAVITQPESSPAAVTDRMLQHFWGADRMWDGLVAPSDTSWRAGAQALADPAAYEPLLGAVATRLDDARSLAASLRALGVRAERAASQAEREAVYGDVLAACTGCHQLLGVTIRPSR